MKYTELNVPAEIHKAVERMGFTELTEVQEKAIPPMLAGRDVIAKAPTGTGKTCAFGIPLILGVQQEKHYPQAVVMAPTRELAQQITEDLRDLAHFYPDIRIVCVYGGANMANPYSMALSERCVELVFHWLPVAVREPQNLEARYYMSFAAVLGMMAYIQGGGLYAHSMSYILTKHLGLPHGMGCGITLPYTLEYNSAYLDAVLVQYGKVLFGKQVPKEEVLKAFRDLVVRVGMPASLREAGMKQEDIDMFAHELHDENYRKKNPREMSMEQARQFMKAMYEGTSGECH